MQEDTPSAVYMMLTPYTFIRTRPLRTRLSISSGTFAMYRALESAVPLLIVHDVRLLASADADARMGPS